MRMVNEFQLFLPAKYFLTVLAKIRCVYLKAIKVFRKPSQ